MMKLNANLDVEIPFSTAPGADAGHFRFGFSLHLPGSGNGNEANEIPEGDPLLEGEV